MFIHKFFLLLGGIFFSSCTLFYKNAQTNKSNRLVPQDSIFIEIDTSKKDLNIKLVPYEKLISGKTETDEGLFKIHKIQSRFYFEIPDSILYRDILVVSRIVKAAAGNRPQQGFFGYSGDQIGEEVIQFCKGPNRKIFIKNILYQNIAEDSSENGMYYSVNNSNFQSIVAAFDIKAISLDSLASVIDVTDYIIGDNNILFFNSAVKKLYGLGPIQGDKSYIQEIHAFPLNIEISTIKSYVKGDKVNSFAINSSLVLLPKQPMKPRGYDARVGYFSINKIDFDVNPQRTTKKHIITRWRLEPKPEDIPNYRCGTLVTPIKPIVFYIDPATPKKWIPYLIQGVNDWQKAFEQAGFKNAIYALEPPSDDPDWSLYDARHNAIIYKPSEVANASGPHVHDPRSGEILETHINWYHNVMQLLHDWYMIQAGPNDVRARSMIFSDELMGQLIRFVCSHEVGHTLGLAHNFGASSTTPVENLRNKSWVEENGFCPSIMDYARFNYVAQPEDSISEKGLLPRIGVYDKWAIEWGYKWFPDSMSQNEEKHFMNQWVITRLRENRNLWFGSEIGTDARRQSEDLGDNSMKASYYGILNLKRILPKLKEWTKEPNNDYNSLRKMTEEVIKQYERYIIHVSNNIGLPLWTPKTIEQKGDVLEFNSKEKQKEAIQFLQEQLFDTPEWIINKEIFGLTGNAGVTSPIAIQRKMLEKLISDETFTNLSIWSYSLLGKEAYTFDQMLIDLESGIWKEIKNKKPINFYRRNLQKEYVSRLTEISYYIKDNFGWSIRTDFSTIIIDNIHRLITIINKALPKYKDKISIQHLKFIRQLLENARDPKVLKSKTMEPTKNNEAIIGLQDKIAFPYDKFQPQNNFRFHKPCWDNYWHFK